MDWGWTGRLGGRVTGAGTTEMYVEEEKRKFIHGRRKKQKVNEDDGEKHQRAKEACVNKAVSRLVQVYLVRTWMISSTWQLKIFHSYENKSVSWFNDLRNSSFRRQLAATHVQSSQGQMPFSRASRHREWWAIWFQRVWGDRIMSTRLPSHSLKTSFIKPLPNVKYWQYFWSPNKLHLLGHYLFPPIFY